MSDIQLANIYFYVDGDLYTTKPDFDHTFIAEAVDMDDLVLVMKVPKDTTKDTRKNPFTRGD
jgi:hypothetical protein|tara:strand:- start:849 stop:1034 length:186 start_codon:yes stop_codon:yes gene_type:complete